MLDVAKERASTVIFDVMEYRNGRNHKIGTVKVDDNASSALLAQNKARMLYKGRRVWAQAQEHPTVSWPSA